MFNLMLDWFSSSLQVAKPELSSELRLIWFRYGKVQTMKHLIPAVAVFAVVACGERQETASAPASSPSAQTPTDSPQPPTSDAGQVKTLPQAATTEPAAPNPGQPSESSGSAGTSGASGASGTSDASGTSGASGASDASGTSDTSGASGRSGASGASGTSDASGTSGTSGASGASGASDASGTPGAPETSATSGASDSSGSSEEDYTVAPGDTLSSIARSHGVKYQDLANWNDIKDPNQIREGQTLRMTPP